MATTQAWDRYDAYLFDIDGTLLNCKDAVHYFAFCEALRMLSGRPLNLDGVVTHGNTDVGILRDALQLAGVQNDDWRPHLREAQDLMGAFVEQRKDDLRAEALPDVGNLLNHLHQRGAVLGVATGNLQRIGRLKLLHCDVLRFFQFEGYSDAYENRSDVFAAASQQARALVGEKARICAVGDTPADVQAARANGLDVIAVATGIFSREQLRAEQPDFCVTDFSQLLLADISNRAT